MKKLIFIILVFSIIQGRLFAQQFENIKASQEGDRIQITYDLISYNTGDKFKVAAFSSLDNYRTPLSYVMGDIGEEISPGRGKTIEWDAVKVIDGYAGNISFELRGERKNTIPMVQLTTDFPLKSTIKRGKKYKINWVGGAPESRINIDLVQNGAVIEPIARSISNSNQFTWSVPRNKVNGNNFQIAITDLEHSGNKTKSKGFKVKTPASPMLKASALIIVIVGAYALSQSN